MKHPKVQAIICLLCLCSCSNMHDELSSLEPQATFFPIQFNIDLQREVLPFPATKSIPPLDIPEPVTKNQEAEVPPTRPENGAGDLYQYIDYLVYKKDEPTVILKHKHFDLNDPDFTIVYDSLPKGEYNFCFLAHSEKDAVITGNTVEFPKVSDTFHLYFAQTIQPGEKVVKDVTLQRIISKIEFMATDIVPEDQKDFTMNVTGYQNKIDVSTGLGISSEVPYTSTYNFKESDIGKENFTHSFFTFVPSNEGKLSTNLISTNQNGERTRTRNISDIQPIMNRIIRYSGHLYIPPKSNDTFTVSTFNEGRWDDTIENNLTD